MPSGPLLVRAALLLALPPAALADPPVPVDTVDGAGPTRVEEVPGLLVVSVEGMGPTEAEAERACRRRRDAAFVARLLPKAHPLQIGREEASDAEPGTWPGAEATARTVRPGADGGFVVAETWRLPTARLLTHRSTWGVVIAPRLRPRTGWVVLDEPPSTVGGLLRGDVLLGLDGDDEPELVLQKHLERAGTVQVERGGKAGAVDVHVLLQPVRDDHRRYAPTCGPCCHGDCGDQVRPWDP